MQLNKFDSFSKTNQVGELKQSLTFQNKSEVTLYVTFFILLLIIEIALIFQQSKYYYYILPKIIVNIVIILYIGIYRKKITLSKINGCLLFTKILTVVLIIMVGQDYFLIFLYILEENQIQFETRENFIQRLTVKLSFLVLEILKQNLLDIFIGISLIILEIIKFIFLIFQQKHQNIQEKNNSIQFQSHYRDSNFSKENTWVSRMSNVQLCYLIISKKTQKITFKNHNFCKHFNSICKSNEEFDDLMLNKMNFQIISRKNQEEVEHINDLKQNRFFKRKLINKEILMRKVITEEFNNNCNRKGNNLTEILRNFEDEKKKNPNLIQNQTLEYYSQYQWDENKISTYSGQIIILEEDNDVILTLIDITKQNKIQEEKIKDQFKTTIVQSFSHELRTPLNSALNFLQFCENDNAMCDEIKRNFISPAINALRLQSYLINDIIDFSSLCAENLELDIKSSNIEQIVDEINKLFKNALEMKALSMLVDLTNNQIIILRTDFSRLIQILANLIQNSIKFSSQGTIIIKITSTNQDYLKISIKDNGVGIDKIRLQQIQKLLKDVKEKKTFAQFESWHGFGLLISQMLVQILQPKEQQSLKIKSEGYLCGTKVTFFVKNYSVTQDDLLRKIQNSKYGNSQSGSNSFSINGSFILISDLDIGSQNRKEIIKKILKNRVKKLCNFIDLNFELKAGEFNNLYPFLFQNDLIKKKQEQSPRKTSTQIYSYEQIRAQIEQDDKQWLSLFFSQRQCNCRQILSVDDEIFNQKSIQFLLKQSGFDVVLAYNGKQALDIVKQTHKCSSNCCLFLFILMDYQMPLMNGLEVTESLKKLMEKKEIPTINIIGLTAFNSKSDIEQCFQAGMNAILTKPLILKELFALLKQI